MKIQDILEHIQTEWTNSPLGEVSNNATTTIEGIKQQLNQPSVKQIFYMYRNSDTQLQIKTIHITQE